MEGGKRRRRGMQTAIVVALCLILVACAGRNAKPPPSTKPSVAVSSELPRPRPLHDGPPDQSIDVMLIPEPVPRVEPRARYGNHSPYRVLGRSYEVLPTAQGYSERGVASWYGAKFHGQPTSTMEPYDMFQFTAAHRSLPLPTYARVTNLENGLSLIVRINDRGPFAHNRLIDLSYAAARRLGIYQRGTGLVEVVALDPTTEPNISAVKAETIVAEGASIFLQVGAFSDLHNAEMLRHRLESARITPVQIDAGPTAHGTLHRVRVGPLANAERADHMTERLRQLGLNQSQLIIE